MAKPRSCSPVLLLTLLAGLASGSEAYNKSVCVGDSIEMFNSIHINKPDTVVNLFRNGDKDRAIASWTNTTSNIIQENVVMDGDKNIWIINVHKTDEGNYIIQYDIRNETPSTTEVQLSVWIAPAITCKPKVNQKGRFLTATLEGDGCGTPMVSVYLKECYEEGSSVICVGKDFAQLQSEREAETFHACMEGLALRCAKSSDPSSNQCSASKIEANQTQLGISESKPHPGTCYTKDDTLSWLISILVLQIIGPAISLASYIFYKKFRRQSRGRQRNSHGRGGQLNADEQETLA